MRVLHKVFGEGQVINLDESQQYADVLFSSGLEKEIPVVHLQEKLTKKAPASKWIEDFVKSKNSRFDGKSKQKRTEMALGAYYGEHNESTALDEEMNHAAHELVIHGENDSKLYKNSYVPVAKNLEQKFKKGTYDHELAKTLWGHHVDKVAQSYAREHGSPTQPWHKMFSTEDRKQAAKHLADNHRIEMEAGNMHESTEYKDILPLVESTDIINEQVKMTSFAESTMRFRSVESSVKDIMNKNLNLRKMAKEDEFKSRLK